jgi:hypothetical protein
VSKYVSDFCPVLKKAQFLQNELFSDEANFFTTELDNRTLAAGFKGNDTGILQGASNMLKEWYGAVFGILTSLGTSIYWH